jgi:hypothetical protein
MTPIDPMSPEAQDFMNEYNTRIIAHARQRIWDQKTQLRELNDQRADE